MYQVVKVELSLCLINQYVTKTYGGSGDLAPPFLTTALDEGQCSVSRPCRFTPGENPPVAIG
jgi:hypothetical protein